LTASSHFCLFSTAPARDDYHDPPMINLLKFSRWDTLLKIVAYCRRWRTKQRGTLTPLEIIEAERAVFYHSQQASYRATIFQIKTHGRVNHDNALAPLAPFMDAQGLIRLAGRTEAAPLIYETKYPLLMHAKDPLTEVLLRHIHRKLMHSGGPRALQTELAKLFWVPRVTTFMRKVAYKCVTCRVKFAKPTTQMMAPLPFFRLPSSRLHPFDHSAIDVAGPFVIHFDKQTYKVWMLVIRCCTVRYELNKHVLLPDGS
jgi:hypothetical protein